MPAERVLRNVFTALAAVMLMGCAATPENEAGAAVCTVVPPEDDIICTMQYDPVCGCDGRTYGNACTARASGVPRSRPGACDDPGER